MNTKKLALAVLAIVLIAAVGYMFLRDTTPAPDAAATKSLQELDKQFPDQPEAAPVAPADPNQVRGRPAKR